MNWILLETHSVSMLLQEKPETWVVWDGSGATIHELCYLMISLWLKQSCPPWFYDWVLFVAEAVRVGKRLIHIQLLESDDHTQLVISLLLVIIHDSQLTCLIVSHNSLFVGY